MNDAVCPDKTDLLALLALVRFNLHRAAKAFAEGRAAEGQRLMDLAVCCLTDEEPA